MFGSTILEVVIGLVFIFLLYSLLATTLQEIVASWLALRGRMLRKAIERMLNDGHDETLGVGHKVLNFLFMHTPPDFEHTVAGKFYAHPTIKYLSRTKRRPSYISAENFSETVFHLLKEKGAGETVMQKVEIALKFNTLHLEPETLKRLRNLYDEAHNNEQLLRKNLEKWFDETMDRTTGWYKRRTRIILFTIGYILAVCFYVDAIQITRILSKDKTAREQMVQMAIASTDSSSAIAKAVAKIQHDRMVAHNLEIARSAAKQDSLKKLAAKNDSVKTDSAKANAAKAALAANTDSANKAPEKVDSLPLTLAKTSYYEVKNAIDSSKMILGLGWKKGTSLKRILVQALCPAKQSFWGFLITALAISLGARFWFGLLLKLVALRNSGVKPEEKEEKKKAAPENNPGGGGGNNLTGNQGGGGNTPVAPAAPVLDLVDATIQKFGAEIGKIPGVTSLFGVGGGTSRVLQVNVIDAKAEEAVNALKKSLTDAGQVIAGIKTVVAGIPSIHAAAGAPAFDGKLANKAMKNYGSLSCVLEVKDTGVRHILSCWHVMKGDYDYSHSDDQTTIVDSNAVKIGERWCGGIAGPFDYALAKCTSDSKPVSNTFLKNALGISSQTSITSRPVLASDVNNQSPVKFFDCIRQQLQAGIVYASCDSVLINYQDKTRRVTDVLVLTDANGAAMSSPGNSGALVFDNSNQAIAMIIGGDKFHTYAIRLSNIFQIHKDLVIGK